MLHDESLARPSHLGMDHRFELGEPARIVEDKLGERFAVEDPPSTVPGKRSLMRSTSAPPGP